MKSFFFSCLLAASAMTASAQGYQFTDVCRVPVTPVKNQASTGTCWCFATTSFMEAELLRMRKATLANIAMTMAKIIVLQLIHILLTYDEHL